MAQENTNERGYVVDPKSNQRVVQNQHNPEDKSEERWVDKIERVPGQRYEIDPNSVNNGNSR